MCLSAEVDAAAGLLIGAVALDAVRHARTRSQRALASLPVILAAHQLVEVLVWWGLDGKVAASTGRAAIYGYLAIAFALPILVPQVVAAIEPDAGRRRLVGRLGAVGTVVGLALLADLFSGPAGAVDGGTYVAYQANLSFGGPLTAAYVAVTLGSLLASSHRFVVGFGVLNLVAVGALGWLTVTGFVSLWCAWAALTSVVIAVHLRRASAVAPPSALRRFDRLSGPGEQAVGG